MKLPQEKICIITGATSGIGLETAIGLAKQKYNLLLISRSESKLKTLQKLLIEKYAIKVDTYVCDLSLMKKINLMSNHIINTYDRIDVLINNVGGIFMEKELTEEGLEMTFALNHMSYFCLTNNLIDKLSDTKNMRIINISSQAHKNIILNLNDLNSDQHYNGWTAYKKSKLANIYFTYHLSEKLKKTPITINSLHPGVVNTDIANNSKSLFYRTIASLIKYFGLSPKEGAQTSIYLATNPLLSNITGLYFSKCKPIKTSEISYDVVVAADLWKKSKKILQSL